MKNNLLISILAAGKGTRMESDIPKVLHTINNKSLVENVVLTAQKLNPEKIIIIVGFKKELIIQNLESYNVEFALQNEQLGTGHAVMQCEKLIDEYSGNLLILSGDVPLISYDTLISLINLHKNNNSKASLISADVNNPKGYGRIKRNSNNEFNSIVEDKDANEKELEIKEINAGIYVFDIKTLFSSLKKIKNKNSQNEYYIGDVFKFIKRNEISVYKTANLLEISGINNINQLNEINEKIN